MTMPCPPTEDFAEDMRIARAAWDEHDLDHAAAHWAGAMAIDAQHVALGSALRAAFERDGEQWLEVIALEDGVFHGTAALRAWFLAQTGALAEAMLLSLEAQAVAPAAKYLALVRDWADDADFSKVDVRAMASAASALLPRDDAAETQLLLDVIERAHETRPEDDVVFLLLAVAHREHGEEGRAESLVHERVQSRPSYEAWIALAGWHRSRGDTERALGAYHDAARAKPDKVEPWLEIGDLNVGIRDFGLAKAAYEKAVQRVPDHPWARPSLFYTRAVRGDSSARNALGAYAKAHPDNARAVDLASRALPFDVEIPPRPESCLSLGARIRPRAVVRMAMSSLEAPSAFACVRRLAGKSLELSVGDIPAPDPRDPIRDVPFVLWKFDRPGGFLKRLVSARPVEPTAAFDPPTVAVWEAIGAMADARYEPDVWWQRAGELAPSITKDGLEPLFASMVHPPPTPASRTPWDWMFRVQIAAAFVLARSDDRWPGPRRDALAALLDGPVDWVTTAALVALTEIAIREPEARHDAQALLAETTARAMSPIVFMCIVEPGVHLSLRLPDLPAGLRAELEARREDIETT